MAFNGNNKAVWTTVETLANVQTGDTTRLVVDVSKSDKGHTVLNVREWWTSDGDSWYPGKKGLALKPEQWAEIAPAIQEYVDRKDANQPAPQANGGGRKLAAEPVVKRRIVKSKKAAPKADQGLVNLEAMIAKQEADDNQPA